MVVHVVHERVYKDYKIPVDEAVNGRLCMVNRQEKRPREWIPSLQKELDAKGYKDHREAPDPNTQAKMQKQLPGGAGTFGLDAIAPAYSDQQRRERHPE